jgi:hypothetical protein
MYVIGDSNKRSILSFTFSEIRLGETVASKDVRIFKVEAGDYAD